MDRSSVLFLSHRIPYPPNKGDKVRSFNLLRRLTERHRVFLGTFVDSSEDISAVEALESRCEEVHALRLYPELAKAWSLRGLLTGEPLSVAYYRNRRMRRWVTRVVREHQIGIAVAFSGPMAQYLDVPGIETRIIDFCDVDSAKWSQYSQSRSGPMAWLYRREGSRLADFERRMAREADHSLLTTADEVRLLVDSSPDLEHRVVALQNGVDADYFNPAHASRSPYANDDPVIVFTGVMDYWPNIDGVTWFVDEILPGLRERYPALAFYIVGMNPTAKVRELGRRAGVVVTGRVEDVRPWIAHATVAVAPLRIARGVQNKVLEAMAMAKPVVVTRSAAAGLDDAAGSAFLTADDASSFRDAIGLLIGDDRRRDATGQAAREHVLQNYSWEANLQLLDRVCAA